MLKFQVKIKGIAPLLQAKHPTPEEQEEILKRAKSAKKTKDLTNQEQFDMHAYKQGKKFVQPSEMIKAAMVRAATNFKLEGKKTYKDLIKSGVIITPEMIVHDNQEFEMDARWGKNPSTRGAVWVVRPRVDEWSLQFTINLFQDERIASDTLEQILTYAGMYVGIGAWRPDYGRFEVSEFKQVKE